MLLVAINLIPDSSNEGQGAVHPQAAWKIRLEPFHLRKHPYPPLLGFVLAVQLYIMNTIEICSL
jgi:hypothetical protein